MSQSCKFRRAFRSSFLRESEWVCVCVCVCGKESVGCLDGVSLRGKFASLPLCLWEAEACKQTSTMDQSKPQPTAPLSTANRTTKETYIFLLGDSSTPYSVRYTLIWTQTRAYRQTCHLVIVISNQNYSFFYLFGQRWFYVSKLYFK